MADQLNTHRVTAISNELRQREYLEFYSEKEITAATSVGIWELVEKGINVLVA